MRRLITSLLVLSFALPTYAKEPTPSELAAQQAQYALWLQQQLGKEAAGTDDAQTKAMLMMMMMQAQQQQQASQKAAKKNKENEDKKEEKPENKVPTPAPLPSPAAAPAKPEENLKLVEEATKQDEEKKAKQAEADAKKADPLADLQPFTLPKVDLGLNKAAAKPPVEEKKEAPLPEAKTALGTIQPPKGENLNFANTGTNGTNTNANGLPPNLMGVSKNGSNSPAQEVVGAERAVASVEENSKANVRKTVESGGGGDSDGDEGGGGSKGGGENDDFFASLMAKMNGEENMAPPEGGGMGSEGDAAAGESAPMSIFQFASMRYHKAATEEGRLRTGAVKDTPKTAQPAEAALR